MEPLDGDEQETEEEQSMLDDADDDCDLSYLDDVEVRDAFFDVDAAIADEILLHEGHSMTSNLDQLERELVALP